MQEMHKIIVSIFRIFKLNFQKHLKRIEIQMKKIIFIVLFIASSLYAQIKFDANFESGNLSTVTTTDSVNYELRTIEDVGGRWFYFKITGMKDKLISVKILNSDVKRPFYSYDNYNFQRFTADESPKTNLFQKVFEFNTVYVSYYAPYTYTYLQERLNTWGKSDYVIVDTLGFTDHNLPLQEITITDPLTPHEQKLHVWIHARTHPGETPSSFQFDGIVQKLLSDDDVIDFYRKKTIFHLYPFNNPEGVYFGRSRTNFYGVDQEREWNKEDNATASEVVMLKNRMKEILNENNIEVFLNLHSQVSPYCTFWIHTPGSTSDYFYRREYQFSNLNISDNPYFYKEDLSESNLQPYFPEGWLWANHGDKVMALTYETPYDRYSNDVWVTNENLYELGYRTVYSIGEYLELSHPKHLILDNKDAALSGNWKSGEVGLNFFSDDYAEISNGFESENASFNSGELESGIYDVYAWWPDFEDNSFNTRFTISKGFESTIIEKTQRANGGQWNFLSEIKLNNAENISINVNANSSGKVIADAFRIIYRGSVSSMQENNLPTSFILYQNYPNPFNPSTTIRVELKKSQNVMLRVFNTLGQTIAVLADDFLAEGVHEFIFNASQRRNLSSGIYYYQLISADHSETKGMALVK